MRRPHSTEHFGSSRGAYGRAAWGPVCACSTAGVGGVWHTPLPAPWQPHLRQGGHQCAEKYSATTLLGPVVGREGGASRSRGQGRMASARKARRSQRAHPPPPTPYPRPQGRVKWQAQAQGATSQLSAVSKGSPSDAAALLTCDAGHWDLRAILAHQVLPQQLQGALGHGMAAAVGRRRGLIGHHLRLKMVVPRAPRVRQVPPTMLRTAPCYPKS